MPLYDDKTDRPPRRDDSDAPSWRERDRKRETGESAAPRGPRKGTKAAYLQERASKSARSDAEALFSNPARDKAEKLILKAVTAEDVSKAVDAYLDKYETLPTDHQVLLQVLKHPKGEIQILALSHLDTLVEILDGPSREMTLRGIRIFQMSARNMPARKAAKRLLKAHPL